MGPDTIQIFIILVSLVVVFTTVGVAVRAFLEDEYLRTLMLSAIGVIALLGIFFGEPISESITANITAYVQQKREDNQQKRKDKIEHLQSEVPKGVKLKRLDSQLQHRDIDLNDADSVSYSDGSLKVFFTQKHLIGSDDLTTWTVQVQDDSIKSVSRSHS